MGEQREAVRRRARAAIRRRLASALPLPPAVQGLNVFVNPEGTRWSLRRVLNLRLAQWEFARGRDRLRSWPLKLTVEATSVCNLRCPACFTGVGAIGRRRSSMPLALFERLMDELGPRLLQVELCNWGEPLLCRHIADMIASATNHGISTSFTTNLSVPFDATQAERLVRAGLKVLGVSIDGARQASYAQYRIRGDLDLVLANCALIQEAKARLGSPTPRVIWCFHVFPHNASEVGEAREHAARLGMEFAASRGWVVGDDWDVAREWPTFAEVLPMRCGSLWYHAVVQNDGGVSPCCGTFYREDDVGRVALAPSDLGAASFREVWNGEGLRRARRLYHSREGADRRAICYECPATVNWEKWTRHRAAGGTRETFEPSYQVNDGFNYFWNRRPARGDGAAAPRAG